MRIVVLGCGRVGGGLAGLLDDLGHQVVIVDRDPASFEKLPAAFKGVRVVGFAFDRRILEEARVESADALVAATRDDGCNIVAALAAKKRFRVPMVVARIYDPLRAEIFRNQGILTVSPVRWSIHRLRDVLLHAAIEVEHEFESGEVVLIRLPVPPALRGRRVADVTVPGDIVVAAITRRGRAMLPTLGTEFEEGDVARFIVARGAYERFESFVGLRP
jgi:trk system potassium uptake protein TrkA